MFRPIRILFIRLARRRYSLFVVIRCSRRITLDARIFHINCCHRCIFFHSFLRFPSCKVIIFRCYYYLKNLITKRVGFLLLVLFL